MTRMPLRLAALLAALLAGRAADAAAFSVSYDQRLTTGGRVIPGKVKVRDSQFRIESTIDGMQSVVIRTADGGIYQYMPAEHMAMKLPEFPGMQSPTQEAADYLAYLRKNNAQRLDDEVMSGVVCEVYQFTDANSGAATTVWLDKQKQFPVKMIQDTPQGPVTAEFSNVQLGVAIPDSAFMLPAGAQVMDMGALGGLMGQIMGGGGTVGAPAIDLQKLLGGDAQ